jgi:ABC-type nitrate/sulfonate/bicarbonate transport system ATPase subunit
MTPASVKPCARGATAGAVLVTHDLGEAVTLADRVLLLCRAPTRIVATYTHRMSASATCWMAALEELERELES